ncbi:hypothetical protein ACIQCR_31460 [Streptomyces sp. NPDC093249]|uniref:hypothetical protein n=1 Tax=unclassified Streptomyces TaxID=2593676 RepID=UPI00344D1353
MTVVWVLGGTLAALVAAFLARGVVRGAVQTAREQVRCDLIAMSETRALTETLARRSGEAAVAFAAPAADGREYPIGWLWWRADLSADDTVRKDMGWALTYRRARRAAGLPLTMKARDPEVTITRSATNRDTSRG